MANPAIHKNQALMRKDPAKHIVIFVDEALTDASLDVVWMTQMARFSKSLQFPVCRIGFFCARLDPDGIEMCTNLDDAISTP